MSPHPCPAHPCLPACLPHPHTSHPRPHTCWCPTLWFPSPPLPCLITLPYRLYLHGARFPFPLPRSSLPHLAPFFSPPLPCPLPTAPPHAPCLYRLDFLTDAFLPVVHGSWLVGLRWWNSPCCAYRLPRPLLPRPARLGEHCQVVRWLGRWMVGGYGWMLLRAV